VSWNAPFKSTIRELHHNWMLHGEKPLTKGGNLKGPLIETYLEWICTAWDRISKEIIVKSFITCGISKEAHDDQIHVFKVLTKDYI
jgi:hypothetical protein